MTLFVFQYERTKIFEDVNNMAVISVTMNRFGRPSLVCINFHFKIDILLKNLIKKLIKNNFHSGRYY